MSAPVTLQALQQRLQHQFANQSLLEQALTHRSFSADHNERLEFLGDSVLNLAVAHMLYQALGSGAEGDLSRLRAQLVRQDSLHRLALDLGFAPLLRLGAGEVSSGGQRRPSILADALEAIIGAVYLDGGPLAADALVRRLFEREVPELVSGAVSIMAIAREAGARTKIAVRANTDGVNPKGALIGPGGARVRAVMENLGPEKIDIVDWSADPAKFVASALSPAVATGVQVISEKNKTAIAFIHDDQLSLAIGKEGQNARLAAKLTGWKIGIESAEAHAKKVAAEGK